MRGTRLLSYGLGVLLAAACAKQDSPSVEAPAKIQDSLKVESATSMGVDKQFRVTIARASLEKEFLLQGVLIPQIEAATGQALKSRIVAFRERGGQLHMLEASQGHEVTTDLPANILIASFPITKSEKDQITFDFNAGMRTLYSMSDLSGADRNGGEYDGQLAFQATSLIKAFIEDAKIDEKNNRLFIRQIAQESSGKTLAPVEVRYYILPYKASADFVPHRGSLSFDRYGYFQTAPSITKESDTMFYDLKWNTNKPIVFAMSSNTPAEFKEAVREGILYWNTVAGREIVQAVDGPAGVTAPDPNYNIVQWVPYDTAGFAFADMQSDPRNGEIRHAQAFITSVFATIGKARARTFLRKYQTQSPASKGPKPPPQAKLHVRGLEQESLCDYDMNKMAVALTAELADESVDDKAALKAARDYVRQVVAHEIGHTLGLRHNFAGSLAMNVAPSDRSKVYMQYVREGRTPKGLVFSSSVMDYTLPEESSMIGDQLKDQALEYDQKAIATLYSGAHYQDNEWPLFCTDSHKLDYSDCVPFDTGKSTIEFNAWNEQNTNNTLPNAILEMYINGQVPLANGEYVSAEKVVLPDPEVLALTTLKSRKELIKDLGKEASIIRVERQFPVVGEFNSKVILAAQLQYVQSEVDRLGGFDAIFPPLSSDFVNESNAKLAKLIETAQYKSGLARQDKPFVLTDSDAAIIEANAAIFFERYAEEYRKAEIKALAAADLKAGSKFAKNAVSDKFATYLAGREESIVLGKTGAFIEGDVDIPDPAAKPGQQKTVKRHVRLPVFSSTYEDRLAAAELLRADRSEDIDWGFVERATVKDDFDKEFEKSFNTDLTKLKLSKMPRDIARWVMENKKIQSRLSE